VPTGAPASSYAFHVGPNNGTLHGRALLASQSDHSGITVTLEPGGQHVVTGASGDFTFSSLYVDCYTLRATHIGYLPAARSGMSVGLAGPRQAPDLLIFQPLTAQACEAPNASIPESVLPGTRTLTVVGADWNVQAVEVDVTVTHPAIGDLTIDLRHGLKTVRLHNRTGAATPNLSGTYPVTLPVSGPGSLDDFKGDLASGTWTLSLRDANYNGSNGHLVSWCLRLNGPANIPVDAQPEATPGVDDELRNQPNPARFGHTTFCFALTRPARATLSVY